MKEQQGIKAIKPDFPNPVKFRNRSQDIGKFFSSMPPWALFIFIVICSVLVVGSGALIGYMQFKNGIRLAESPLETAVTAILGLLAFMLGFTFSATWSRFASRNSLVIAQAKAIQTCYLRAGMIPEKQKIQSRNLLREYTSMLLKLNPPLEIEHTLEKIEQLHLLMWEQAVSLVQEDMDSELRTNFTSSINDLLNLAVERKTLGMVFQIPDPIWGSLLFLAGMGMFAFGYQSGIGGIRGLFDIPLLPVAFGLVIVLIADLNSTGVQRRFKVTRQPIQDVLNMINKDTPYII